MSDALFDIVDVNINENASTTVSAQGFSLAMILTPEATFVSRTKLYGKGDAYDLELIGGKNSVAYKMAQEFFAQNPSPVQIMLGRQADPVIAATFSAGDYTSGTIGYTLNAVAGTPVAYNASKAGTLADLATAIQAAIRLLNTADTTSSAVYSNSVLTITMKAGVAPIQITLDLTNCVGGMVLTSLIATSQESTEDVGDALTACRLESTAWFGLLITDRTLEDVEDAVIFAENNGCYFLTSSADHTNITDLAKGTDVTSIAWFIQSGRYSRSRCVYNSTENHIDAGLMGAILWRNPGTYTCQFKTIVGAVADILTTAQHTNAHAKNCLTYETVHGIDMIWQQEDSAKGYIDYQIFKSWLMYREGESVLSAISGSGKTPYTSAGIMAVANAVEKPLIVASSNDPTSPAIGAKEFDATTGLQNGGYYLIIPTLAASRLARTSSRQLPNMQFVAFYSGAIETVQINGNINF